MLLSAKMSTIQEIARNGLKPYRTNANSGNLYEIWMILIILRKMGLTNEDLDTLSPLFMEIEAAGRFNKGTLLRVENLRKEPVGNGFNFFDQKIVQLKNATQDDSEGTGDLILITDKDEEIKISITEGPASNPNNVSKCLTNAGARRFGCTDEDIKAIKLLENSVSKADKDAEMILKFGEDKTKWKKKAKTDTAIKPCAEVAKLYETRFNSLSAEEKRRIMNDVHWLCKKPADYVAFVNKKNWQIRFFKVKDNCPINKDTWNPTIKISSVFIETYHEQKLISKTQVKFNNGVGTSMRKWTLVANLNYLFNIEHVPTLDFKPTSP
jgi:hypothetical protein